MAEALDLPVTEYLAVYAALPLKDREIGRLLENKLAAKITAKQILEARHRARDKIKASLLSFDQNERTSVTGKNKNVFSRSPDRGGVG